MRLSQKGFSLVQVMLAIGAMGGAALLFMRMNQNQLEAVKGVEQRSEIIDAVKEIGGILQDQTMCTVAFGGKDAAFQDNATPNLTNILGREVFKINERLPTGLMITNYILKHEDPAIPGSAVFVRPGEPNGQTYLIVDFQLNKRNLQKKVKLDVTMNEADNNTKIVTCRKAVGDVGEYATEDYVDEALAAALGKSCVAVTESSCPAGWTRIGTPRVDSAERFDCTCNYKGTSGSYPDFNTVNTGVALGWDCPTNTMVGYRSGAMTCVKSASSPSFGSHCCKE